jgi:hypothetical protein
VFLAIGRTNARSSNGRITTGTGNRDGPVHRPAKARPGGDNPGRLFQKLKFCNSLIYKKLSSFIPEQFFNFHYIPPFYNTECKIALSFNALTTKPVPDAPALSTFQPIHYKLISHAGDTGFFRRLLCRAGSVWCVLNNRQPGPFFLYSSYTPSSCYSRG